MEDNRKKIENETATKATSAAMTEDELDGVVGGVACANTMSNNSLPDSFLQLPTSPEGNPTT